MMFRNLKRQRDGTEPAHANNENAGKLTGDDDLKHEGQADQAVDKAKDAVDKVADKAKDLLHRDK